MPRGRLIAVVLGLAVALVGSVPAEASTHKAKPACAKKGSKTVASSRAARVFATGTKESGRLYGCWKANGRRVRLATRASELEASSGFSDVRLVGRYVAWFADATDLTCAKYQQCPPGYSNYSGAVHVYDLRARRTVRTAAGIVTSPGLALTQRGAVAWISGSGPTAEVHAADGAGTRTLDTGAIAPASLKAEISIVSWVRDGVERFARLR